MKKYRKEITFDLNTNELKKVFGAKNYTKAYSELRAILEKEHNFEHRQGFVYCSFTVESMFDFIKLLVVLKYKCPWLKTCLKRMDTTNVGFIHEVTRFLKL